MVAFSVVFMVDMGKRLLAASPLKPFVWKRFISSLWKIPMEEVFIFVNFANSFHKNDQFYLCCEMSSERAVFLDTDVFKGPRFQFLEFSIHKLISSPPLKLFSIHTSVLGWINLQTQRIMHKCILVYKCLYNLAPPIFNL